MAGKTRHASFLVAAGILLSRIAGLVRQRVFAHYFGQSVAADAFNAAFRIPNFLQNLFGEGVLSASFIPTYSRLLARGDEKEAGRLAGAIVSIILLVVSVIVLAGVMATPWLVGLIAPGFDGERRELTITLTRIFFPGAGLLVLSAWCLGILNSHRKFFLSYAAPVLWNAVMIGAMVWWGRGAGESALAVKLAWASIAGSAAQFLIQLPVVLRIAPAISLLGSWKTSAVGTVTRNFVPVFIGRGVVQLSAFVDTIIVSFLPQGMPAALGYAQVLYTLPVSLFGMSVSAAELPEMSSAKGSPEEVAAYLRKRLNNGLSRIAFFIVPSAIAFLALGDVIVAALFQTGRFTANDTTYVWAILAGSTVGLLAATLGRLYASTYYALQDTKTPLKYAIVRVLLATALGYTAAVLLPRWMGWDAIWGGAGLTAASGVAAWVEFYLLRRKLNGRIGSTGLPVALSSKLWLAAIVAAALGWAVKMFLPPDWHPIITAGVVLPVFGAAYFSLGAVFRVEQAMALFRRLRR
ncbi:MAG TPA: murein biosynthesis integral membrane protein MurJ [Chthoniobacterales bacterium]|jgi:putative peptidoglycan lipid II flippase